MKRLIRYHNKFDSDAAQFSTCGTEFEVLPCIEENTAAEVALADAAARFGFKVRPEEVASPGPHNEAVFAYTHLMDSQGNVVPTGQPAVQFRPSQGPIRVTHAAQIGTVEVRDYHGSKMVPEWIGWVTMMRSDLDPHLTPDGILTVEDANSIACNSEFGVQQVAEAVSGETVVIMAGWEFYAGMRLHGYSHEQFKEVLSITEEGFDDDTSTCSDCGKADSLDEGYQTNFRDVNGDWLGINCGCYEAACMDESALDDFVNKPHKGLELKVAHHWMGEGRLRFVGRWMGGMTDPGRGGYWGGPDERAVHCQRCNVLQSTAKKPRRNAVPQCGDVHAWVLTGDEDSYGYCDPANPDEILKTWKAENPDKDFVISHDKSGQFQTYWSLWEVIDA